MSDAGCHAAIQSRWVEAYSKQIPTQTYILKLCGAINGKKCYFTGPCRLRVMSYNYTCYLWFPNGNIASIYVWKLTTGGLKWSLNPQR